MTGWKHVRASRGYAASVCVDHAEDAPPCGCTTPTPDPTSPCGAIIRGHTCGRTMERHGAFPGAHVATRCTCGHALVPA